MNISSIILGFAPFLLFRLLADEVPVGWAALAAAVVAAAITAFDSKGGIKILSAAGVVILGALSIVGFVADTTWRGVLADNGAGVATILLALYILVSVYWAPFTAQFARQGVPREHWHDAGFIRTNQRISAVWGCTILLTGVCAVVSTAVRVALPDSHPLLPVAIAWGLPIWAIIATVRYTKAAASSARAAQPTSSTH